MCYFDWFISSLFSSALRSYILSSISFINQNYFLLSKSTIWIVCTCTQYPRYHGYKLRQSCFFFYLSYNSKCNHICSSRLTLLVLKLNWTYAKASSRLLGWHSTSMVIMKCWILTFFRNFRFEDKDSDVVDLVVSWRLLALILLR